MKQMHTLSALISTPEISCAGTIPWLSPLLDARERDFRGSAFLNNQLAAFFNWPSKKLQGDQSYQFPQLRKQLRGNRERVKGPSGQPKRTLIPDVFLDSKKKKEYHNRNSAFKQLEQGPLCCMPSAPVDHTFMFWLNLPPESHPSSYCGIC